MIIRAVQQVLCAADHAGVEQAMQQCIQNPSFGREQDALCGWLYEWYRSDDPILQRFVARFAPALMKRYMFHCLSTQQTQPVPGLEVSSAGVIMALPSPSAAHPAVSVVLSARLLQHLWHGLLCHWLCDRRQIACHCIYVPLCMTAHHQV